MKLLKPALILICLCAAGYLAFRFLFPDERKLIIRELNELAETVTITPETSMIARGLKASKVTEYFTRDIEVIVNFPSGDVRSARGIEDLRSGVNAVFASARNSEADLRFYDITVELNPEETGAEVQLNAIFDFNGQEPFLYQELEMEMLKEEDGWKIRRIETVRTHSR